MNFVNKTKSAFKNLKTMEILFVILLIIYLLLNIQTPYNLVPYVNNIFGYGSLLAIVILLMLYSNPLVSLLFAITSIVFIYRSRRFDHNVMAANEINKNKAMQNFEENKKTTTLEEEIVGAMVVKPNNIPSSESYQPLLCDSNGATEI